MKVMFLAFTIFLSSTSLMAQQLPEWYRVYTFDDSIIEMNTSQVTFGSKSIGRVRFRWSFDKPQLLSGEPQTRYKSKLEVLEFHCSDKRFRLYEVILFDAAGKVIRVEVVNPPGEWSSVTSGSMMERLFTPACQLIELKRRPPVISSEALEMKRAERFALSFSQRLEQTRDFTPLVKEFFATDYLSGYIQDQNTNWFFNLNRKLATQISRAELQRFYLASLNAGYLSGLYLISQYPSTSEESVSEDKLIPPDIVRLIKNHPYTATYKGTKSDDDHLAENIDSIELLSSYTDLLERVSALLRKHVIKVKAERSAEYRKTLDDWNWQFKLYQPQMRVCASECLGLPKGTRLFEINVPLFRLQLAEINGEMRIVSARQYFQ